MRKLYTFLSLLLFLSISANSQINQVRQADKLYEKYDYIDAQKVYLNVIERGHTSAQIYKGLGNSYYFQSNYYQAARWYTSLLEEYPEEVESVHYLRTIQSYKGLKEYDKAEELLQAYTEKFGETSISKHYDADPNYLESIRNKSTDYKIKPLGINVSGSDHSPAFYGENQIVFASPAINHKNNTHKWDGSRFLDLFISDRDSLGDLSRKRPIMGDVNTRLHESAAVFSKDGKTMYFTRNNMVAGKRTKDKQDVIRLRIFKAERQEEEDTWKVVQDLPFNQDSYSTAYPALNAAEDKLYFSSDKEGTLGMSDLWYVAINRDGTYGEPVHLGDKVNTEGREAFSFIDENNILYFASDGQLGLGGLDIYKTQLDENGLPTEIENLGEPFNSSQDDFALIIEPDNEVGYFTSNRGGRNSENDDIYYFYRECSMIIEGQLKDKQTKELLSGGRIRVLSEDNTLLKELVVGTDASYRFEVDCNADYLLQGSKDGYSTEELAIHTPDISGVLIQDVALEIDGPCAPNDLGCRLALEPIYFDFDKDAIRPDAEIELSKILEAMKMYPELVIHIESHTDSRGNDAYNMALSERRAQSTRDWLINEGISSNRLTARGYGESRLVNHCSNGVPCSVEEHQLNRRSMFIIQN